MLGRHLLSNTSESKLHNFIHIKLLYTKYLIIYHFNFNASCSSLEKYQMQQFSLHCGNFVQMRFVSTGIDKNSILYYRFNVEIVIEYCDFSGNELPQL